MEKKNVFTAFKSFNRLRFLKISSEPRINLVYTSRIQFSIFINFDLAPIEFLILT